MSGSTEKKSGFLASFLNLLPVPGGLGYFYLGQVRKGALAALLVLGLHLVNALGTLLPQGITPRLCWPLLWVASLLTALDAWHVARRAPGRPDPGEVAVPALRWLGRRRQSTSSTSNG